MPYLKPAATSVEAHERFLKTRRHDPLPTVDSALLNSGDVYDYICQTGMLFPFVEERDCHNKFKPASFEVDFLGTVVYMDENGQKKIKHICRGDLFVLPKNSIVYVYLDTMFRLPDYIALRFNLRIKHVTRGILLGTGPLVDPGYIGKLFIPLHNLTSRDYELKGGEGLIWIEFTKLSRHRTWDPKGGRPGAHDYFRFDEDKAPADYNVLLRKAIVDGEPAASSIPGTLQSANNAVQEVARLSKRLVPIGISSIVIAIVSIVLPTWALIQTSFHSIQAADSNNQRLKEQISALEVEVKRIEQTYRSSKTDKNVQNRPAGERQPGTTKKRSSN